MWTSLRHEKKKWGWVHTLLSVWGEKKIWKRHLLASFSCRWFNLTLIESLDDIIIDRIKMWGSPHEASCDDNHAWTRNSNKKRGNFFIYLLMKSLVRLSSFFVIVFHHPRSNVPLSLFCWFTNNVMSKWVKFRPLKKKKEKQDPPIFFIASRFCFQQKGGG